MLVPIGIVLRDAGRLDDSFWAPQSPEYGGVP